MCIVVNVVVVKCQRCQCVPWSLARLCAAVMVCRAAVIMGGAWLLRAATAAMRACAACLVVPFFCPVACFFVRLAVCKAQK